MIRMCNYSRPKVDDMETSSSMEDRFWRCQSRRSIVKKGGLFQYHYNSKRRTGQIYIDSLLSRGKTALACS